MCGIAGSVTNYKISEDKSKNPFITSPEVLMAGALALIFIMTK